MSIRWDRPRDNSQGALSTLGDALRRGLSVGPPIENPDLDDLMDQLRQVPGFGPVETATR